MEIKSGQTGVLACMGDSCSDSLCVEGNQDYFFTWKYEGLPIFRNTSFSWKVMTAVIIFIFCVVGFGIVLALLIFGIIYLITRFWGRGQG
jgi:hypothetical protein